MEQLKNIKTENIKDMDLEFDEIKMANLIEFVYLTAKREEIARELPNIGSSRSQEDESYRWRYALNKTTWLEACLLQTKAVELDKKISTIKKIEKESPELFALYGETLSKLINERDEIRAKYMMTFGKVEELNRQNTMIESYEIYLGDLQLKAPQILDEVEKMSAKEREEFFKLYGDLSVRFMEVAEVPVVPTSKPSTMGE